MSRPSQQTTRSSLAAIRSRLGKAAVLGGRAYVERVATSDEFAALFMTRLNAAGRKEALASIARIIAKAPEAAPRHAVPTTDRERVKVRWTDEMIGRFKYEALRARNDVDLAARLGLPPSCRGAMRAARSRYRTGALTTVRPASARPAPALALPLAA